MIIETKGLVKEYRQALAVRGLDLAIPDGSISGFLGPNGSGKTTTIKMLLGLVRPTAGDAIVLDSSINDQKAQVENRRRIGYVSEDKRLYPFMTLRRILDFTRPFFPRWNRDKEVSLIRQFNLPLERRFRTLSKGMRTKLALVLALSRDAELLILDEPSEGLDPVAAEQMLEAVVQAAGDGATVFFSSHQIDEVERIADHVFIIDDGRLVLKGSLEELRENCRRIHAVFPGALSDEEKSGFDSQAGVRKSHLDGHVLSMIADGNVEEIAGRASALGAISINIQPINLREMFLESVGQERYDLV